MEIQGYSPRNADYKRQEEPKRNLRGIIQRRRKTEEEGEKGCLETRPKRGGYSSQMSERKHLEQGHKDVVWTLKGDSGKDDIRMEA